MDKIYWYKKYPNCTVFIFVISSIACILLFFEICARLFIPSLVPDREERSKFWQYDSLIGWAHIPGQIGRFNHRDFSVSIRINNEGLRDQEHLFIRDERKRILILGDSFGWGFGVEENERFSEIIEKIHPEWEIINASVSGYGTDQEYLYLINRGFNFHPDVVLLLFNDSDFINNTQSEQYWHFKPYFDLENSNLILRNCPVRQKNIKQRIQCFLYGRTYLGGSIQKVRQIYRNYLIRKNRDKLFLSDSDLKSSNQYMFQVTKSLIFAINQFCIVNNIKFVLISTPMDDVYRSFLENNSISMNILFLGLDKYFSSNEKEMHFKHDGHWNRLGNRMAAEAIDDFFKNKGIL
jgi:hypothetical protein